MLNEYSNTDNWDIHWGNTVTDINAARVDDIADYIGVGFGHDHVVYVPSRFPWIKGLDNPKVSSAIVRIPSDVSDIKTLKRYLDAHCTNYDITFSPCETCLYLTSKLNDDEDRIDVDVDYETHLLTFRVFKDGSYK